MRSRGDASCTIDWETDHSGTGAGAGDTTVRAVHNE